jgi:hypothetical protein
MKAGLRLNGSCAQKKPAGAGSGLKFDYLEVEVVRFEPFI